MRATRSTASTVFPALVASTLRWGAPFVDAWRGLAGLLGLVDRERGVLGVLGVFEADDEAGLAGRRERGSPVLVRRSGGVFCAWVGS